MKDRKKKIRADGSWQDHLHTRYLRLRCENPEVMSGAVVFKGTRIPVQSFVDHLDQGGTVDQFLEWYDGVNREQLEAAAVTREAPASAR